MGRQRCGVRPTASSNGWTSSRNASLGRAHSGDVPCPVERADRAWPRFTHERRTVDFEHLIQEITNAVLNVPLVRDLMSFVDTRWRPLWAATWVVLIALGILKIIDSFARVRARQSYLQTNAVVARQLGET